MELVEGPTLSQVLSEGPIPPARAGRILRDIAGALHVIHAQGICHRDVKPDNIMLRRREANTEQSVLIDFSVAIVKDADSTFHGLSLAAGTLRYMAPEQILGFADEATDIYSLARVTIEMITGQIMTDLLPYAALDLSARLRELLQSWGHLLSEESIEMLASAQEFDPAKRPHIVAEFAAPVVRDLLEAEARAT
jgi:serine/threonine-protein kinase